MFFSITEVFDIILMSAALGFIFQDFFKKPRIDSYDPLLALKKKTATIEWHNFWFALSVTAPAIILHELGHKFTAIAFGQQAVFHAAYFWLVIGIVLKLMKFKFIFFIPGYVMHSAGTVLQSTVVAFAGPAVNLILWIAPFLILRYYKVKPKWKPILILTQKINLFLFVFNMLPIPPFDGFKVFSGLFHLLA